MKKFKLIAISSLLFCSLILHGEMPCYDAFNTGVNQAAQQYNSDMENCGGIYSPYCEAEAYSVYNHRLDILEQEYDECMNNLP